MTNRQISLARHALGLDGRRTVSYRNRFVSGELHHDHPEWIDMVAQGYAQVRWGKHTGDDDLFWLTRKGAERALLPGERLDTEDFPAAA
ncbi:hypothetical protein [Azospirillum canadense]|uniref:hypothetical protein n=1 Tax=Azospirillum canadense TaxID=403962 RepID=UPI00222684D9|nr:hypothetical protein [Azospirillum canadense]MCW2242231.1 hypothetical protein [Azospirillum canadense]